MASQYLPPNPDGLKKIKHIVVLMMENRSFDNLLGWLYDGQTPPRGQAYEGLNWDLWNPLDNYDSDGNPFTEKVPIRKMGESFKLGHKTVYPEKKWTYPDPDPGEGYKDTNDQLFGTYQVGNVYPPTPTNMGFVNNYQRAMLYGTLTYQDPPTDPRDIMFTYTSDQVPVLSGLAKSFAVCDQYCASVPSQTLCNRDFVHAATSKGQVNNDPYGNCDAKTIFQQMQDAINAGRDDLSWKVYSGTSDGQQFSLTRTIMTQLQDPAYNDNFFNIKSFYQDCKAGTLPSYSFLEPQFSGKGQNDQHPPQDIRPGEILIAAVYKALTQSPCWNETLFVLTYDEHGGCYDHYAPSGEATNPDPANLPGEYGFLFNRFGVRVPTILVSPWIQAGTIARPSGYTPFDHTSIIKTIQNCFGLEGHLTERDKAAPDLSCVLTLTEARTDMPDQKPLPYRKPSEKSASKPNDLNKLSVKHLCRLTGAKPPKNDKDVHQFIHDQYEKHFGVSKKKIKSKGKNK